MDTVKHSTASNVGTCLFFIAIIAITILFTTCGLLEVKQSSERVVTEKIANVQRVLMHRPDEYTLLVKKEGTAELESRTFQVGTMIDGTWTKDVRLFTDVPAHEEMWVIVKRKTVRSESGNNIASLEIHLHAVNEINGAGWKRKVGKNHWVQETTEVIE